MTDKGEIKPKRRVVNIVTGPLGFTEHLTEDAIELMVRLGYVKFEKGTNHAGTEVRYYEDAR